MDNTTSSFIKISSFKITTHKFNLRTNDLVNPAENPFTDLGLQICMVNDINNLTKQVLQLQSQVAELRGDQ